MNLISVLKMSDAEARAMLEEIRWPNGPVCPHCAHDERIHPITGKSARDGLYECGECNKQFTVTVGTVMHNSRIPLAKWIAAFYMICSHKKGVSAAQLQRDLDLGSYRTAWHMAHRIRAAMQEEPLRGLLAGSVEVDETYVGGKPRPGKPKAKKTIKRGRGTKKTAVLAMVERNGRARSGPVERVDAKTLKGAVISSVDPASVIYTDEWRSYTGLGKSFPNGHKTVNHSKGEYVNGDASTNTVESYFALMKRGVYGTFHHVSKKHIARYCDEFSFRWNTRKMSDGEAALTAISGFAGKRLPYAVLIGKESGNAC